MKDDWQPLDVRLGLREPFGFDEGVPKHLEHPLVEIAERGFWAGSRYKRPPPGEAGGGGFGGGGPATNAMRSDSSVSNSR